VLREGTRVGDRFVVERPAGLGGMGAVYRARDRDGRAVALKVIEASYSRERFAREARILAELRHPCIVPYVAHGVTPEGVPWLAMAWLEGLDLERRLEQGPLSVAETLDVARRAADALAALHARGFVHRDVKPANLLLADGRADRLFLIDFGISRPTGVAQVGARTRTGVVVGTVGYMAPEQAKGEPEITAAADVFSLGCVLHECVTGEPVFGGQHPLAILVRVVLESAPSLHAKAPWVPAPLAALVDAMLAKDPSGRPADGQAVFDQLADRTESVAVPPAPTETLGPTEQRIVSLVLAAPPRTGAEHDTMVSAPPDDAQGPLAPLRATVEHLGGTIVRLADGSLLVAFTGAAIATDLACHAASAALGLAGALPGFRLAVATGRGVLGGAWPAGPVAERAAALLGRAEGVRIDEVTAGLVDARFVLAGDDAGLRLVEERPRSSWSEGARPVLDRSSPFVGREAEVEVLLDAVARSRADRAPTAVVVFGGAGLGKTRLRREVVRRMGEVGETLGAPADALRTASPWSLLAEVVSRSAGIDRAEPDTAAWSRLVARVSRHVDPRDVERVATFLGEALGMPSRSGGLAAMLEAARHDPAIMATQVDRAFVDLLVASAAHGPVSLVFDDLQWADAASIRAIDAVLRAARGRPLVVLAFGRPELRARFPDLWRRHAPVEVELAGLSLHDAETLVRGRLADEVPRDRLDRLLSRAEGNPFFLEELARAQERDRESAETVVAILQARFEALSAEARRTLRAASVFGRRFWRGGVASLVGAGEPALCQLEERELIVRHAHSRLPGQEEWAFVHDLARDAAYGMLTETDRSLGHRLALDWLVGVGEGDPATLAEHADLGGDRARAARAWTEAARSALSSDDYAGALAACARALAAGIEGAERGALRVVEAQAANWLGDTPRAMAAGAEATQLLPDGHPDAVLAWSERSVTAYMRDDVEALVTAGGVLARMALAGPREALHAIRVARVLGLAGQSERSGAVLENVQRALDRERTGALVAAARAECRTARTLSTLDGDPTELPAASEASALALEAIGDLRMATNRRIDAGWGWSVVGVFDRAEALLRAALGTVERIGADALRTLVLHNLGPVLAARGAFAEAIAVETEALESSRAQGDVRMAAGCLVYLARIRLAYGDPAGAMRDASDARVQLDDQGTLRCMALAALADAHLALGHPGEALASAEDAMATLDARGVDEGELQVRATHARALAAAGREDAARAALVIALARREALAARIRDDSLRAAFLANAPGHATLAALAGR